MHAAICDVIEPWEHGTVVRSTRYPSYYDFNAVRVEDAEPLTAERIVAVADRALAGLGHRRVHFDHLANAEPLRGQLEASGWTAMQLLWMRHEGLRRPPGVVAAQVVEVPYDAVAHLRVAWARESAPERDPTGFHHQAREVALRRRALVLAAVADGAPIGYAQIERNGDGAEVTQVYVARDRRGSGIGAALTAAAIGAAGAVRDVWITADDEDRPKHLYERLGFRSVWTAMELQRVP